MWDVRTADPWHSWLGRLHLCDPNPVPSVPDSGIVVFRIRIRAIRCYVPKPDPGLVPVDRYYGFGSEPWVSMSRIRIRIWIRPGGLSYLYIVLRFSLNFLVWLVILFDLLRLRNMFRRYVNVGCWFHISTIFWAATLQLGTFLGVRVVEGTDPCSQRQMRSDLE